LRYTYAHMDVDSMFMFKFAAVEFPFCMILSQNSSKKRHLEARLCTFQLA